MITARRLQARLSTSSLFQSLPGTQSRRLLHSSGVRFPSVSVYFPTGGSQYDMGTVRDYPKRVGAAVEPGDVVAEIEAGPQMILDVQTLHKGEVTRLICQPGEPVKAGDALIEIEVSYIELAKGWWRSVNGGQ
eukprot:TRINITY_DN59162_c0_g1_i1.p1 TRINITY_DN59162_c0_g1~~TRINITY_DN59162_c0_g1_i1.p1  ORF type:complete len:133 (-),score=22.86 TRINITY_DN59162_c0_g1_i1:71-469(-)